MRFIRSLGLKAHLLTAISYLIPIVCGAGFLIAIGMIFGGNGDADLSAPGFSIWDGMAAMGAAALVLLPMIIATGISYSIAAKPGIAPGLIIGLLAGAVGAGFIGGLIGGFLAGYLAQAAINYLKVPKWARALMPMVIVPFLSSLVGGVIMLYVIGAPIAWFTDWLTGFLGSLTTGSLLLFGLIVGVFASIDYGGPINKTVFAFAVTLLSEGVYEPIAALIVVNTATAFGFALALPFGKMLRKDIYAPVEKETLKSSTPMGVISIVEGVLPIVLNDIVRCVVATGAGGAVGGAIAMTMGVQVSVPFGGFLVLPATINPLWFVLAVVADAIVIGLVLALLKKRHDPEAEAKDMEEEDINDADFVVT